MELDMYAYVQNCSPPKYADLMRKIIKIESSGNPFAIGVVGARLVRQPHNLSEAVATVNSLFSSKHNFSIGLSQVNKIHFQRLGWINNLSMGFDACENISAGAEVLDSCFVKAHKYYLKINEIKENHSIQNMALSCYYSGDLFLGERLGYVRKVLGNSSSNHLKTVRQPKLMDYSNEDN